MSHNPNPQSDRARRRTLAVGIFLAALCARVAYIALRSPLLTADGSYYYAVARSLAGGRGFTISYVWHYLGGIPARLPISSNDYWMPLSSVIQAGALRLGGSAALVAACLPGIIAGAALASVVFWLSGELFGATTSAALLGAAMWALSAHMVPLSASPDCFMVAGLATSLSLIAIHRARTGVTDPSGVGTVTHSDVAQLVLSLSKEPPPAVNRRPRWAAATPFLGSRPSAVIPAPGACSEAVRAGLAWAAGAGALSGLAYLVRADGLLVAATFVILWAVANRRGPVEWRTLAAFGAAFIIIAAPWWTRNWIAFGSPLGAPLGKTAFLASYNDIFRVDSRSLNLGAYLGLSQMVQGLMKLYALWREIRLLAVICGLALPFAIWAIGRAALQAARRDLRDSATKGPRKSRPQVTAAPAAGALTPWLIYTGLAVLVPALVFPYPALKGTFWHLAPGLCVFIFAAGAAGISDAAQRLWRLNPLPAKAAAVALPAAALGLVVAWYGLTPSQSDVERSPYRYAAGRIVSLHEPVRVALTDDTWSLYHFAALRCAQLPTDGAGAALQVADRLGANYLFVRERSLVRVPGFAATPRCRRFEPVARWGHGGDTIHAYHIMPFAPAERIAKSHNAQGMALAAAGRYERAVSAFEAAASYKPDFPPIIANIALACWQAGRRQEAYLRAAQALALDPENPTAKRIMAEAGR